MSEPAPLSADTLRPRKITLQEMEEFCAGLLQRLSPAEGQAEFNVVCAFNSRERDTIDAMRRFFTWLIPHEIALREIGNSRRSR